MNENLTTLDQLHVDIATMTDDNGTIRAHYMCPKSSIWPVHGYKVLQDRYIVCGPEETGGIMTVSADPKDHAAILEAVRKYFSDLGVELMFNE